MSSPACCVLIYELSANPKKDYHNFWYKVLIFWHFSSDDVWCVVFMFVAGEEKTPRERWKNGWASSCPLCQSILIIFIGLVGHPPLLYLVCSKPSLVTEFSVVLLIDWYNWRHEAHWYSWDPLYAAYWNFLAFNHLVFYLRETLGVIGGLLSFSCIILYSCVYV